MRPHELDKKGPHGPLEEAREELRRRLARDLHDDVGQLLSALRLELELHRRRLAEVGTAADPRVAASVAGVAAALERVAAGVRRVVAGLHPEALEGQDLATALERLATEVACRTGMAVTVHVDPGAAEIPREAAAALYRAAQELLTNVVRHARAAALQVDLRAAGGHLVLQVSDDGVGAAPDRLRRAAGRGLRGLRERAAELGGRFSIERRAPQGTCAMFQVPF